jgi:hypothetical protein
MGRERVPVTERISGGPGSGLIPRRSLFPSAQRSSEIGTGEAGQKAVREGTSRVTKVGGLGGRMVGCVSRSMARPGR